MKLVGGALMFFFVMACDAGGPANPVATNLKVDVEDRIAQLTEFFADANIVSAPRVVDCTLSGGTATKCFSITVKSIPKFAKTGSWCPRRVSDGPEQSGIWLDKGAVYDADGKFMNDLGAFYNDEKWQMVNPLTGEIKVTDTKEKCAAAARDDRQATILFYGLSISARHFCSGGT